MLKDAVEETDYEVPDERLRLIFTCCHPALNEAAQVALTLRKLCGLDIREIARSYLTSEVAIGRASLGLKRRLEMPGSATKFLMPSNLASDYRLF